MFRNLYVSIDTMAYDENRGYTLIEGWAFNPVTKDPVRIESNIPILYNTLTRPDISDYLNVDRDVPYGFFIQFPGDYRKVKPKFTFKSGSVKEKVNIHQLNNHQSHQKLRNLFWILTNPKLLGEKILYELDRKDLLGPAYNQTPKDIPTDEYEEWMMDIEPELFHEPVIHDKKVSFVLRTDNDDIEETVESIRGNGDQEILVVSDKDIDIDNFKVFKNTEITEAIDAAVEEAQGDYIVFVDNKDLISPYFINELNYYLDKDPEAEFIYSDSDLIDSENKRYELNFKTDFDPTLLSFTNYILNPVILSKELYKKIGGFRKDYYGLKDYDLILRAGREAQSVLHIPRILYHWKKGGQQEYKKYRKDLDLGIDILNDYLKDQPFTAKTSDIDYTFEKDFEEKYPSVTLVIGVLEGFNGAEIKTTVESILNLIDYPDLKIKVVNSPKFETKGDVSFEEDLSATNLAELYNKAAETIDTEYIVFIRPSFRSVEMIWLREMIELASYPDVGIVGPKIYSGLFQYDQGGVGIDDKKRFSYARGINIRSKGAFNRYRIPKEVFAVSTDCMLIETKLFKELGGFNTKLPENQVDLDLSIRARLHGKKTVSALNTPVTFSDIRDMDGSSIKELFDLYDESLLKDQTESPHLKDSGTARPYMLEK